MMDGGCYEDSSYNSTSENELDSDPEDPERLLNEWLGELNTLTGVSSSSHFLNPLHSLRPTYLVVLIYKGVSRLC